MYGRVLFVKPTVMQMNDISLKSIQSVKILLTINFTVSVIVLIAGSLLCLTENSSIFVFNEELYGALDNNLLIMMVYLAITEIVILGYCFCNKNFQVMIVVGFFLILLIGSMELYEQANAIEIDNNFRAFFFYTGLSHILFGAMTSIEKNKSNNKARTLSN
jgi:hypothetical protein